MSSLRLTRTHFRLLHLHHNNRRYHRALRPCEWLFDNQVLFSHSDNGSRQAMAKVDQVAMRRLFEAFIRAFCDRHPKDVGWALVQERRVPWPLAQDERHPAWLPGMYTDVQLERSDAYLIIDTKFTPATVPARRGDGRKARSSHLYQLSAYLNAKHAALGRNTTLHGLLLYVRTKLDPPGLTCKVPHAPWSVAMTHHTIHIRTLDLNQPPATLGTRLIALLNSIVP